MDLAARKTNYHRANEHPMAKAKAASKQRKRSVSVIMDSLLRDSQRKWPLVSSPTSATEADYLLAQFPNPLGKPPETDSRGFITSDSLPRPPRRHLDRRNDLFLPAGPA